MSLFRSSGSIPPTSLEKLSRINIDLDCKSVLEVQLLHDNNHSIIRSLSKRADKCYLPAF